jgi:hypothetical protein
MKTPMLILCFALLNYALLEAQNQVCEDVYNKYAGKKGSTTVDLQGSALNFLMDTSTNPDFRIDFFRLLSLDDSSLYPNINFYDEIVPQLDKNKYKELLTVNTKDRHLILLFKHNKNKITEFILVSGGKSNLLINFTGQVSLSEAKKVSKAFCDKDKFTEPEPESQDK